MKPKYWTIIILFATAICIGAFYYIKQPTLDPGGLVTVHHIDKSKNKVDNRILLTQVMLKTFYNSSDFNSSSTLQKLCQMKTNVADADRTATYKSKEKGISFNVPFNPLWGTNEYRIYPYEDIDVSFQDKILGDVMGEVVYGPLVSFEGCSLLRGDSVKLRVYKSADELIKNLKSRDDYETLKKFEVPTIVNINGLQAVKFKDYGLCDYPTLIVIGKKFNYEFTSLCFGTFEKLEQIIKTIKFIE